MAKPERGLFELYTDPERADFELWGRRPVGTDRRGFLKGAGLAAMEGFLRAGVPMSRYMPAGLIPVPLAGLAQPFELPGKSGLIILNDRPIGAECPDSVSVIGSFRIGSSFDALSTPAILAAQTSA